MSSFYQSRRTTERYKEKINKFYDKKKAEVYDEYLQFKKKLADEE